MREVTERQRHRTGTYQSLSQRETEGRRLHKIVDERVAAVRRWIEIEEDEANALRGID
jgi:hypothetical protein